MRQLHGLFCVLVACACVENDVPLDADGPMDGGVTDASADGESVADGSRVTDSATDSTTMDAAGSDGSDVDSADADTAEPPYPDLALSPYASLVAIVADNAERNAAALDTSMSYDHSAAQGYLLQAIGELLLHAQGYALPARDALIRTALGEIEELRAADSMTTRGGPAFGLPGEFDAFGDGSVNPPRTAYTWQSGMVALGVAKVARALVARDHPEAERTRDYALSLVEFWSTYFTETDPGGYWWYSTASSDDKAVHNTSALIAMAAQTLASAGEARAPSARARQVAELLWARMSGNPTTGYTWNYVDDGYPAASRRAEDISHAAITLQLMRMARDEGWWTNSQMQGVSQTLLGTVWTGNPIRLRSFVDGRSSSSDIAYTRAAVIGFAAHSDAPGGDPRVFEVARSILFSSYFSRFDRELDAPAVDSARLLACTLLLTHRPPAFAHGTAFEVVAGPGDDLAPDEAALADGGGARFYTVDWATPSEVGDGLSLPARRSTAANANFLVDLAGAGDRRVIVSLTYQSEVEQTLGQWNGDAYLPLATLPATRDEDGRLIWFRTSLELAPVPRFDYQASVPGVNVLLQLAHPGTAVHRIEATPL